jgi:hypothetical protein
LFSESVLKVYTFFANFPGAHLLAAAAFLLGAAVVLLTLARKRRIILERSPVTDELLIYLSRIADAVERPNFQRTDRIMGTAARSPESAPPLKLSEQAQSFPYSILGQ